MALALDMHCDTVSRLWRDRQNGDPKTLRENDLAVDLRKMQAGGYLLQNFAAFVFLQQEQDPLVNVLELIDEYWNQMEANQDLIAPVLRYADIEKNRENGKLSGMLTVEEGGVCKGSVEVLRDLYRLGVRMMTLTWNFENEIGFPHTIVTREDYDPQKRWGLKPRGIEIVREMNRLGMIVDVSHLGDDGFWDVVKYCDGPFVASHSNARAVCGHTRNLTDGMIRALADKGGVMGLNFCGDFLERGSQGTLEEMIRHLRHVRNVGGIGVIGLGTDFDGIDNVPEVEHAGQMPRLAEAMDQAGFSASEIDAVFSGNVLRVYRACMK